MRYFVMIGAVLGMLTTLVAVFSGASMGNFAALACAFAVVPYVGWRASQIDDDERENKKFRTEILALMKDRPPTP